MTTLTLDCYGTLVDWEAGTIDALRPLLARHGVPLTDDQIITAAQEIEEPLCQPPFQPYRAVLAGVVEGFGQRYGFAVTAGKRDLLARSVPSWRPFPDTVDALRALRRRFRLAVISNIDDDLFAATAGQLGVAFDLVLTSEQARCYKPDPAIFVDALRRLGVAGTDVLHAAEGTTEIAPARHLGCATAWVRRHGRSARLLTDMPDLDVPDLRALLERLGMNGLWA